VAGIVFVDVSQGDPYGKQLFPQIIEFQLSLFDPRLPA
jgi:hypothetical protein